MGLRMLLGLPQQGLTWGAPGVKVPDPLLLARCSTLEKQLAMREQSCTQTALWGLGRGFKGRGGGDTREVMNPGDLCQGSGRNRG